MRETESDRDWETESLVANERDPREAPFGFFAADQFGNTIPVFLWFESVDGLIDHLLEVEPRAYDIVPGEGLETYQARIRPILARARHEGLTEALRREFDATRDGGFYMEWWGTYAELRDGDGEFARAVRRLFFQQMAREERPIGEVENAFVEFLAAYRV